MGFVRIVAALLPAVLAAPGAARTASRLFSVVSLRLIPSPAVRYNEIDIPRN